MRLLTDIFESLYIMAICIAAICIVAMGICYILPIKPEWKKFSFRCAAWASIISVISGIIYAISLYAAF